jgi:hypothetical protein
MKAIIIAILILLAQEVYAVNEFGLEGRMESKEPDAPPPAIAELVRKKEKKDLNICQKEKRYTKKDMQEFFGAAAINLNDDLKDDYILYPKKYCGIMFGAHAIPYWIVMSSPNGYRLVMAGGTDAVTILDTKKNGARDIVETYGETETKFVFYGKKYEIAK